MTSRAFRAAFLQLVPEFERTTQNRIVMISGVVLTRFSRAVDTGFSSGGWGVVLQGFEA